MKTTIFSIDSAGSETQRQKFEQYLDACKLAGCYKKAIGAYEGRLEHSWIMLSDDFDTFVLYSGFVAGQESVLRVSGCNKMYTLLEWLGHLDGDNGKTEYLGCMKSVTPIEALENMSFTFRPDMNTYWITVKDNPNHRPEELV